MVIYMKIKGANLGEVDGEVGSLSSHKLVDDPNLLPIIQYLESLYFKINAQAQTSEVHEFPCEDGKVCIKPGMINHICSNNLEVLKSISKYGIVQNS